MVKNIPQMCYPTGDGNSINAATRYIYRITKQIIYKKENRVELDRVRYISSPTLLKLKKSQSITKISKDIICIKDIEWIGAPRKYIEENNLKLINLKEK